VHSYRAESPAQFGTRHASASLPVARVGGDVAGSGKVAPRTGGRWVGLRQRIEDRTEPPAVFGKSPRPTCACGRVPVPTRRGRRSPSAGAGERQVGPGARSSRISAVDQQEQTPSLGELAVEERRRLVAVVPSGKVAAVGDDLGGGLDQRLARSRPPGRRRPGASASFRSPRSRPARLCRSREGVPVRPRLRVGPRQRIARSPAPASIGHRPAVLPAA